MIAIIPARGGSKGLPGKNIKKLHGHPMISYTIRAALEASSIDRVIVSTDDIEIARIAESYGAEIPFLRPKYLAEDNSKAIDTYLYTIDEICKREAIDINSFVVLLPTSPLRESGDIDAAVEIFDNLLADSVISVNEVEHPPQWIKHINSSGALENYFEGDELLNRQEYKDAYVPNGAIYVFSYDLLSQNRNYYSEKTYPYIMCRENSVDVDTLLDFKFAEFLMGKK
jgi:N-acylneuraminate cytidylyltransferase/CMP-N,N'-diacetyllegionaminic acid synthase